MRRAVWAVLLLAGCPDPDRVEDPACQDVLSAEECSLCCIGQGFTAEYDFAEVSPGTARCVCIRGDARDPSLPPG